jgi:hypothetical protein
MNKRLIGVYLTFIALAVSAGTAFAVVTMDNNPTNEREDRKAYTAAAVRTAQLMEQMLIESKKTNQLLDELIRTTNSRR